MKFILLILFFTFAIYAQTEDQLPGSGPQFPTEKGMEPLPGTVTPTESSFEKSVQLASEIHEEKSATEKVEENVRAVGKNTGDHREDSLGTVLVGYQLITTWIPFKKTISYTHIFNRKWSLEGEYAFSTLDFPFAGVDLGKISEKRFSLMGRYYPGNSFNFQFGPYYNDFEAEVGNDILENVTGTPSSRSIGVEGLGFTGGLGNRWQWGNGITLGIDWLRLNVPLITTEVESEILSDLTNEDDESDIRKVIHRFNRIPTFVLFGINVGYTF